MALPSAPIEPEQGAVQEQEALEAMAPPPIEPTPTQADAAVMQAVAQNAVPAQPAAPVQQPGYTVKNPYTLMPPGVNFRGVGTTTPKAKVQRAYDIGLFWQVLASDPNASELTRFVARGLTGKKR